LGRDFLFRRGQYAEAGALAARRLSAPIASGETWLDAEPTPPEPCLELMTIGRLFDHDHTPVRLKTFCGGRELAHG
jgi:hypothetical protein